MRHMQLLRRMPNLPKGLPALQQDVTMLQVPDPLPRLQERHRPRMRLQVVREPRQEIVRLELPEGPLHRQPDLERDGHVLKVPRELRGLHRRQELPGDMPGVPPEALQRSGERMQQMRSEL